MLEFEEDRFKDVGKKNPEDYDLGLGMAISSSLAKAPGSQILSPEDVQNAVSSKIQEIVKKSF